ncbi:methyltransferase domain-containing protein [Gemmatimonadota bacterium]
MAFPAWFDKKFGLHTVELYHDEVRNTDLQVEAAAELAKAAGSGPLLDLCCGWGRHSVPLARRGYRVLALDGSRYFLGKLCSGITAADRRHLAPVRADMRAIPLKSNSVALAFQMYTSFGYGTEGGDDPMVLSEVLRVLRPGGSYLLDLINWNLARRAFDGKFEEEYADFDVVEECRIDPRTEILRVKRALLFRDGRPAHSYEFEIRMFDRTTLTDLLEAAGFTVVDFWGDFDKSVYSPARSLRMIAICRAEKSQ